MRASGNRAGPSRSTAIQAAWRAPLSIMFFNWLLRNSRPSGLGPLANARGSDCVCFRAPVRAATVRERSFHCMFQQPVRWIGFVLLALLWLGGAAPARADYALLANGFRLRMERQESHG